MPSYRENIENILEDVLNVTKTVAIDLKTVEDDDNFARISKNIRSSDKDLNLVLFHAKPTIVTKRIPYKIRTSFPNVHLVLYGNTNEFKSVCEIGGSQMSAKSSETAVYAMLADQASDIMIEVCCPVFFFVSVYYYYRLYHYYLFEP